MANTTKTFPSALAALLRRRNLKVPAGLTKAPPQAYANQSADLVSELDLLDDAALLRQAERIAGYAKRQQQRIKALWDESPLIRELRRRKLPEPPRPERVVAASVSYKRALDAWSDAELVQAAREWSEAGRTG